MGYRHLNEKRHKPKENQMMLLGTSWVVESFKANIPTVGTPRTLDQYHLGKSIKNLGMKVAKLGSIEKR